MGLLFRRAVKSSTKEDIKAGMILGGLLFLAQPLQIIGAALHNALEAGISGDNVCDNCAVYFVACAGASVHRIRLLPQGQWRFSELG